VKHGGDGIPATMQPERRSERGPLREIVARRVAALVEAAEMSESRVAPTRFNFHSKRFTRLQLL